MTLEGIELVVIGGHTVVIWGASSVEVEYSALLCNHNYSLCCEYIGIVISRVYFPASNISVCRLRVLEGEEPHCSQCVK